VGEAREVESFNGVSVSSAIQATVTISKGGEAPSLVVTSQANIMRHIKSEVRRGSLGHILILSLDPEVSETHERIQVDVIVPEPLRSISASEASHVTVDEVAGESVNFTATGASSIKVDGQVDAKASVTFTAGGASNVTVDKVAGESVHFTVTGASTIAVRDTGKAFQLNVEAEGASSVDVRGLTSQTASLSASGASDIKGPTKPARTVDASLSASGSSEISVRAIGSAKIFECSSRSSVEILGNATRSGQHCG